MSQPVVFHKGKKSGGEPLRLTLALSALVLQMKNCRQLQQLGAEGPAHISISLASRPYQGPSWLLAVPEGKQMQSHLWLPGICPLTRALQALWGPMPGQPHLFLGTPLTSLATDCSSLRI